MRTEELVPDLRGRIPSMLRSGKYSKNSSAALKSSQCPPSCRNVESLEQQRFFSESALTKRHDRESTDHSDWGPENLWEDGKMFQKKLYEKMTQRWEWPGTSSTGNQESLEDRQRWTLQTDKTGLVSTEADYIIQRYCSWKLHLKSQKKEEPHRLLCF